MPATANTQVNYPSASLLKRLAAMLYDFLLIFAFWAVFGIIITFVAKQMNGGEFAGALPFPVTASSWFTITFLFYTYFWRKNGQTLGMQAWRIKLVSEQAGGISTAQCILRIGIGFFSLACGGLGYFWMLWDKQGKTWHDQVSMSKIVILPKELK